MTFVPIQTPHPYCLPWRVPSPQEEDATRVYNRCMAAQEGVCWAAARQAYRDAAGGGRPPPTTARAVWRR